MMPRRAPVPRDVRDLRMPGGRAQGTGPFPLSRERRCLAGLRGPMRATVGIRCSPASTAVKCLTRDHPCISNSLCSICMVRLPKRRSDGREAPDESGYNNGMPTLRERAKVRPPEPAIKSVIVRASEVIGNRTEALRWLGTPVRSLDFATPISLLGTSEGMMRVTDVLGQMEHGVW